jgi:hypothetical protein
LLKSWGYAQPVLGYYLGLRNQRIGPAEADRTDALFYEKPADFPFPQESNALYYYIILVEHIVGCADHPTVHHYERQDGQVVPGFATTVHEETLDFCRKLHGGVLDFVVKNPHLADDFRAANLTRDLLLALVDNFFKSPTPGQVRAVMKLTHAIDQTGVTNPIPIAKPLTYQTALLPILPKRNPRFAPLWKQVDCFWPEGSFAITPPPIQQFSLLVQDFVKLGAKAVRLLRHPQR